MIRYLVGCALAFLLSYVLATIPFLAGPARWRQNKKRARRIAFVFASLVMALYAFLLPEAGNRSDASLLQMQDRYRLVLTGTRLEKDASFFSRLLPVSYADTFWVDLPRAEGTLTGKDFLGHAGRFPLFGKVDLRGASVLVELYFDNAENKSTDPMDWNGTYRLVRGNTLSTPVPE